MNAELFNVYSIIYSSNLRLRHHADVVPMELPSSITLTTRLLAASVEEFTRQPNSGAKCPQLCVQLSGRVVKRLFDRLII